METTLVKLLPLSVILIAPEYAPAVIVAALVILLRLKRLSPATVRV